MKRVFKEVFSFKKEVMLIILTVIGSTMCTLGLPLLMSRMINVSIPKGNYMGVIELGGTMLVLALIGVLCGIVTSHSSAVVSMGVGKKLRSQIFKKVQYFSQTEFDKFSSSSLITRTNNDISQVQNFLNQCLRIAIQAPITCIGAICLTFYKSFTLSSVLMVAMPVVCVVIWLLARKAIPLSTAIQSKIDRINLVMREKLTGVRVIRAFGTSNFESEKFQKINADYKKSNITMQRITGSMIPLLTIIVAFTAIGVMLMGEKGIANGADYQIGDIIAIIQYVLQVLMSIMMLSMIVVLYPRAATAAKRADEILNTEPAIKNSESTKDNTAKRGYLTFKNVTFQYPGADEPAIKNISFEAKPGETTAIIGGTGMGKSTIVNLIPRFYDVTQGEVLVDDINVKDYDQEVLRNKIGFVPQKANLFSGTIESNIRFGDKYADDERIEKAAEIAQSKDFIMKKEEGFNAPISQGGQNVSGGQRQRLAIARAIVRKPEIYVFDDSFSALDFKTDKALRNALSEETGEATVVIVAQRVSTIMEATRIIVLDNGNPVGIGTHSELLKSCEIYKEIVNSQMSKEESQR